MDGEDYRIYCQNGDEGALARLIGAYKDGLILFVKMYTDNIHTAEDVVQDVFIKLAVQKPRYTGEASFKTWLYRIAANRAIDLMRKTKRELPLEDEAFLISEEESLEQMILRSERQRKLREMMKQLPPDYQKALWLVYFQELPVKAAAKVLGRTGHAMEMLLSRARKRLKQEWMNWENR